jgi:hypothetical protein
MVGVRFNKASFFDRPAVIAAVGRQKAAGLSKAGAFIRQRAKTSIRKREKISEPGSPPNSHVGTLKDRIVFQFYPHTESVVVGPTLFRSRGGRTVPQLLEFGGRYEGPPRTIYTKNPVGRGANGKFAARGVRAIRLSSSTVYSPRPFMGPALEKELPNIPSFLSARVN